MKKIVGIFYSALMLAIAGCDTVEDSFLVGERPKENEILSLSHSLLDFKPEGESLELQITSIAKWEVSLANNDYSQFSVTPSSGKGDGVVVVTCKPNSSQSNYNAELSVSAQNFSMDPKQVSLRQNNASFSIESLPSVDPVAEEGGANESVKMTAYSSLNWVIEPVAHDAEGNIGDISWLTITPGLSGEGNDGVKPIMFSFIWAPNYTQQERTISLQFKPSSSGISLTGLPKPFTLKQKAGTLPQDVNCVVDHLGVVDADLSLTYRSKSTVKNCGINIYNVQDIGESLYKTLRLDVQEYDKNGNYSFQIKDLPENSKYRVEPFVENEVGSSVGYSREIFTGTKPENMVYQGVSILNADNGGVSVATDLYSATLSFTAVSDVEPLGAYRIASVNMSVNGQSVLGSAEIVEPGTWNYVYVVNDLQPNQEYQFAIEVIGSDLPREQGVVSNNKTTFLGSFKTKGMTPDFEDNSKPNVGE